MFTDNRSCPLCSIGEPGPLTEQRGYHWLRCPSCGFSYLYPQPSRAELSQAYQQYLPTGKAGMAAWRNLMADVFHEAIGLLGSPDPERGRLLDVGCAYGFFLEQAQAAGWQAQGIDLSEHAVNQARGNGLEAELASVEDCTFPDNSFDAITLFYVLEHVPNPLAVIRRVFDWLRPGGQLLLRVPHTSPLVRLLDVVGIRNELLDPPFHLVDFSPRSLALVLERAGFEEISTLPGSSTRPNEFWPFAVTKVTASLAHGIYRMTAGRVLLPGVSKTTLARKPAT